MKVYLLLLSILLMMLCLAAGVCADTRIFDLSHRRAAEIAEMVQATLGDDAKVTAIDHSVVVSADTRQLSVAAELIKHLDRPPKMLRVIVAQGSEQAGNGANVDAAGRVSVGTSTVVVGRPEVTHRGGATVISGKGDGLTIGADSSSYRSVRSTEQFIVTLEGSPARISIGKRIPFTERWLVLARRHAQLVENVHYESVDTGFEVQPELIGDNKVQLSIRPFMAFQDPIRPREIQFQELTTKVNVPLGQWLDLTGTMVSQDEVSREILGVGYRSEQSSGTVRVRVELHPE